MHFRIIRTHHLSLITMDLMVFWFVFFGLYFFLFVWSFFHHFLFVSFFLWTCCSKNFVSSHSVCVYTSGMCSALLYFARFLFSPYLSLLLSMSFCAPKMFGPFIQCLSVCDCACVFLRISSFFFDFYSRLLISFYLRVFKVYTFTIFRFSWTILSTILSIIYHNTYTPFVYVCVSLLVYICSSNRNFELFLRRVLV